MGHCPERGSLNAPCLYYRHPPYEPIVADPPFFSLLFQIKTHARFPARTDTVSSSTAPSMSPWKPALLAPPQLITIGVSTLACDWETGLGCDRGSYLPRQRVDPCNLYTRWSVSRRISAGPAALHWWSGSEEAAVPCGGMCDLKRPLPPVEMLGESVKGEVSTRLMRFVLFPRGCSAK